MPRDWHVVWFWGLAKLFIFVVQSRGYLGTTNDFVAAAPACGGSRESMDGLGGTLCVSPVVHDVQHPSKV